MTKRARVLIVDDHPLVREGLAAQISAQTDLEVCGEASSAEEALLALKTVEADIVIVDLALKNSHGLDLIKKIRKAAVSPKILVVSTYEERLFAGRIMHAGAQGYVNKQEAQHKVIDAIHALLRGELYLSAEMTQQLLDQAVDPKKVHSIEALSDRELEIFQLIGLGHSTRSIAQRLNISVHTVETHRENIRGKLGLRHAAELVQRAVQWRLENG